MVLGSGFRKLSATTYFKDIRELRSKIHLLAEGGKEWSDPWRVKKLRLPLQQ
jgi:hypothetical protein